MLQHNQEDLCCAAQKHQPRRDLERLKMVKKLLYLALSLTCLYTEAQISPLIRWRPGRCPELKYRCTWIDCNLWCMRLEYRYGICIPITVPCNIFTSVRHNQCICFGPPAITTEAPVPNENSAAPATSRPQPASQTSTLAPPEQNRPQATEIVRTLTPDPRVLLGSTTQSSMPVLTTSALQLLSTLSVKQAEIETPTAVQSIIQGSVGTYSTTSAPVQNTQALQASSTSLALTETTVTPPILGVVLETATSRPQPASQTSTLAPPEQSTPQATEIKRTLTPDHRVLLGSTTQSSMPVLTTSAPVKNTKVLQASSTSSALTETTVTLPVSGVVLETATTSALAASAVIV